MCIFCFAAISASLVDLQVRYYLCSTLTKQKTHWYIVFGNREIIFYASFITFYVTSPSTVISDPATPTGPLLTPFPASFTTWPAPPTNSPASYFPDYSSIYAGPLPLALCQIVFSTSPSVPCTYLPVSACLKPCLFPRALIHHLPSLFASHDLDLFCEIKYLDLLLTCCLKLWFSVCSVPTSVTSKITEGGVPVLIENWMVHPWTVSHECSVAG